MVHVLEVESQLRSQNGGHIGSGGPGPVITDDEAERQASEADAILTRLRQEMPIELERADLLLRRYGLA